MDTTTVSFSDRLQESFQQLTVYVPGLIGALVILFAGYLLARLFEARVVRAQIALLDGQITASTVPCRQAAS